MAHSHASSETSPAMLLRRNRGAPPLRKPVLPIDVDGASEPHDDARELRSPSDCIHSPVTRALNIRRGKRAS
jgi:hypothetical protein